MAKFLEGKKTYIGRFVTAFGLLGLNAWITPAETEQLWTLIFELGGIAFAIYGRIVTKAGNGE